MRKHTAATQSSRRAENMPHPAPGLFSLLSFLFSLISVLRLTTPLRYGMIRGRGLHFQPGCVQSCDRRGFRAGRGEGSSAIRPDRPILRQPEFQHGHPRCCAPIRAGPARWPRVAQTSESQLPARVPEQENGEPNLTSLRCASRNLSPAVPRLQFLRSLQHRTSLGEVRKVAGLATRR